MNMNKNSGQFCIINENGVDQKRIFLYESEIIQFNNRIENLLSEEEIRYFIELSSRLTAKHCNKKPQYSNNINWEIVGQFCEKGDIIRFGKYINTDFISKNVNLDSECIEIFGDQLNYIAIARFGKIEVLEKYQEKLSIRETSYNPNLTIEYIAKHEDELCWEAISENCSEDILRKFIHRVKFGYINSNGKLSFGFYKEFRKEIKKGENERYYPGFSGLGIFTSSIKSFRK